MAPARPRCDRPARAPRLARPMSISPGSRVADREAIHAGASELQLVPPAGDDADARPPQARAQRNLETFGSRPGAHKRMVVPRPALFDRLARAGRVTQLSAPAGSGKTLLVRSWIRQAGLAQSAAWVSVGREEHDPQQFWLSVLDALRATDAGSTLVRDVSAAPDLDVWRLVERSLEDLASLEDPLWLVIEGPHELRSNQAVQQLELFLRRAPEHLRIVLCTRRHLRLGLHRLRLEGALSDIRARDLRFTMEESRVLFEMAGVELSDSALALLLERTEGWAAGLRMAALSLAGHPDPDRFAAEFSGSERTVAEYLMAEVLDRQPAEVRRMLLRTSVLDRVSGPLADSLTGENGAEWILQDLEDANAFVVSLDARRTWFRYHWLFAELLQLELRRSDPDALRSMHAAAAEWFGENGYPFEAVRHAQAAENWSLATRLLSDHWVSMYLDGQAATAHELLDVFPPAAVAADAELSALRAANELRRGRLDEAERYHSLASNGVDGVPAKWRGHVQAVLVNLRLFLARGSRELVAAIEEAQRLLGPGEPSDDALGLGPELRALTLITLGSAEHGAGRFVDAEQHFDAGIALARRIGRPYVEIFGLAWSAQLVSFRSIPLAIRRATEAIELAGRHGWTEEPIVSGAYAALATAMVSRGRLDEAQSWLESAERSARSVRPAAGMVHYSRALYDLARGQPHEALAELEAAARVEARQVTPLASRTRSLLLQTLVRLGHMERVEQVLADMDGRERDSQGTRVALAMLRLDQDDPEAATAALAPVLEGTAGEGNAALWATQAFLLEAIARHALGDAGAAERALERALDLAEPDGLLLPFLLHPAQELLERHCRHRTTHASLVSDILALLGGGKPGSALDEQQPLGEPLTESEVRVLRHLPTNLSQAQIAAELYVSVHTIRTHVKHLYAKLDVHERAEAVERARALGLLGPSSVRS